MSIEYTVKLYGCEYKCGKKHIKNKNAIEDHEKKCWFNPENKTCKTCKHEIYYKDSDHEYDFWWVRDCKIDCAINDYDDNRADNEQVKPEVNCDKWKQK